MRTEQLHYLNALQKYPSFNSAAAHLNISFQALFRSINHLEDELGLVLVERTPRGVTLTEDGKRLIAASQSLFSEIEDMQQKRKGLQVPSPITIPTTQSVVTNLFEDFLVASYSHHWPIRMIELSYQEIFKALLDGRYRLIISHQTYMNKTCINPLPEHIIYHPIFRADHILTASRKFDLPDKNPISFADLQNYPFAAYKRQNDEQAFLLQILLKFIPAANFIIEENFSVFNQLLLQGIAIGYGSPAIFKEKQMRVIPLQESSYSTYGFMWLKSSVLNAQEKQSMNIISQYVNGPEFILK